MNVMRALALALGFSIGATVLLGAIGAAQQPVVVVYPLTVSSGADPEAGASIAVAIAQRLAISGGISVKPYPPGIQRTDFQTAAEKLGADYYISGFLTPLGDQISMVTQIVNVASGTIITSSTAFVKTYADAAAQADPLREAILRHSGRAYSALDNPPRETPSPKPAEKNEANLTGLGALFKKKNKAPAATPSPAATSIAAAGSPLPARVVQATAAPTKAPASTRRTVARATATPRPVPTPRPTAAPTLATAPLESGSPNPLASSPTRVRSGALAKLNIAASILVLVADGDADSTVAGYTQDSLVNAVARGGTAVAALPAQPSDLPSRAREFCGLAFGAKTIYAPTLTFDRDSNGTPTDVELDVLAYDCGGNVAGRQHARARIGNRSIQNAIDRAAAEVVGAFAFANQTR